MEVIERIKKVNFTVEIVLESGLYRFRVYCNGDCDAYGSHYTPSIETAYKWLVGVLVEWADANSFYRH